MKTLTYSIERRDARGQTRLVGGFADRLKGIAFAYALALLTRRSFQIDWSRPCMLEDLMPPQTTDWRITESLATRLSSAPRFDWVDDGFTESIANLVSGPLDRLDATLFEEQADVVVHANSIKFDALHPHSETLSACGLEADSALNLFASALETLLSPRLIQKEPGWGQWMNFRQSVGVVVAGQFRTGASTAWKDPALDDVDNSEAFAAALLRHAGRKGLRDFGVFFTSDNNDALRRIDAALPAGIPRLFFPGERVHLERSSKDAATAGALQVALEHTVISACDHVVIGAAQFGLTAAFRGRKMPVHYKKVP
jgi:hypothetical protein